MHAQLQALRRHWRAFVLVLVLSLVGAAVATAARTATFESSTTLLVTSSEVTDPDEELDLRRLAAGRARALARLATVDPVRAAVSAEAARSSGLSPGPVGDVRATATGDDPLLTITVRHPDPRWAQAVAEAYPLGLAEALVPLDPAAADAARDLRVLSPAELPVDPADRAPGRDLLLALVLGTLLATGLVVLRAATDRDVRDAGEVARELDLPVRAVVPLSAPQEVLPVRTSPSAARAQAYRALQAGLSSAAGPLPRTLLLTSASPGEGVTSTAANLAIAVARSGRSVVLVDANLRDPQLHEVLGLTNRAGLAEVLAGTVQVETSLQRLEQGRLLFLSAGVAPVDPAELLSSRTTPLLLEHLRQRSDIVIVDAPPLLPVADAVVLAAQVDAVLLVVRSGRKGKDRVRQARDAVVRVQGPLQGVVVNGAAGAEVRRRLRGRRTPEAAQTDELAVPRSRLVFGRRPEPQADDTAPSPVGRVVPRAPGADAQTFAPQRSQADLALEAAQREAALEAAAQATRAAREAAREASTAPVRALEPAAAEPVPVVEPDGAEPVRVPQDEPSAPVDDRAATGDHAGRPSSPAVDRGSRDAADPVAVRAAATTADLATIAEPATTPEPATTSKPSTTPQPARTSEPAPRKRKSKPRKVITPRSSPSAGSAGPQGTGTPRPQPERPPSAPSVP